MIILVSIIAALWIYILTVLHRAKLTFFYFITGSIGSFLLMMYFIQPLVTVPLTKMVASGSGAIGEITGLYSSYSQYAMLFIHHNNSSISLYIDYECSGIIEMMAFCALLWFFPQYKPMEKALVSIIGLLWIFASNIIRILMICVIVYYFGNNSFYFAHTIFGRMVFYALSIMLYFHVFTKSQIIRQRVGGFSYEQNNELS